jgi:hypothetical protein
MRGAAIGRNLSSMKGPFNPSSLEGEVWEGGRIEP